MSYSIIHYIYILYINLYIIDILRLDSACTVGGKKCCCCGCCVPKTYEFDQPQQGLVGAGAAADSSGEQQGGGGAAAAGGGVAGVTVRRVNTGVQNATTAAAKTVF